MSDKLQSNEPSILLFLQFTLPHRGAPSSSTSCVSDRCTWVNSVLANRFSTLNCSAAVGNRSSSGCITSCIKSTSSAYSISSGSPSGEIGGGGGGGGGLV